jgi:phytoene/squalene synthetase
MWSKNFDGIMSEEFYDVVLEISAYAKKHLDMGRSYADKLPKNSHKAFLLAIEADTFLTALEAHNFDIFDEDFRKKSFLKVPYAMYKGAKNGNY